MPPTEHKLHRLSYGAHALFDAGGGCNAGEAPLGSVKLGLTIAG